MGFAEMVNPAVGVLVAVKEKV